MGDAIHVVDRDLRVVYANPTLGSWIRSMGIGLAPIGKTLDELFPNLPQHVYDEYQKVFATGQVVASEDVTFVSDREIVNETRKIPVCEGERVTQVLTVLHDITERRRGEEALRASEEKYRYLVEKVSDVIYALGADGRLTYLSPSIEPLLGYAQSEIVGRHFAEYVYGADLPRLAEGFQNVLAGRSQVNEYGVKTKAGEIRWIRTSSQPVLEGGRVVGVYGVLTDITERKEAEERLRESEERLRGILSALHETAIVVLDKDGVLTAVWADSGLEQRYGMQRSDIVGASLADILDPDEAGERLADVHHVYNTGASVRREFSGEFLGVVAFVRDISERVRAEQALRESEERWRSLVQYAPDLIITVDRAGDILFINRAPAGTDLAVDDILGTNAVDYALPEHRDGLLEAIESVFERGESAYCEVAAPSPADSSVVWFAVHAGPLRYNEKVVAALLLARDITERRQIQEMKDSLIRDVSHELRTPLAKVQMSLELLSELLAEEPIDRQRLTGMGDMASRNAQRLLHTVEGILDLSSLEAGGTGYNMEEIALAGLIHDAVLDMRPISEARGLDLIEDIPESLPTVDGDRDKLLRVLTNLIDNAIKFTDSGRILVSASLQDAEVEVAIADTGAGIQQANLQRVFVRFFQEKTRYEGVGVGLTICKRIVKAHNGRIWAESGGQGQGATLRFTLPLGTSSNGA
jgi:PAS domain S-box-containing protein